MFIVVSYQELHGLQIFQCNVARQVSKPHMSAKFHGLVCDLRCLKEKKMKNFETYRGVGSFYLTPFPCSYLHHLLVSGVAESCEAVKFQIHRILKLKQ